MIYTYLLRSVKYRSYYTGISNNPAERLIVHNRGGLKVTASKRPYELVYCKAHKNYTEARKHEKWLKKKGREYKGMLAEIA